MFGSFGITFMAAGGRFHLGACMLVEILPRCHVVVDLLIWGSASLFLYLHLHLHALLLVNLLLLFGLLVNFNLGRNLLL